MQAYKFRRVSETEPTKKGGLYKRGHYDLVIFNPDFVKKHSLNIVCGKNYKEILSILPKLSIIPLIWVCEIVYFPGTKQLPDNAIKTIEQDTLKVKETKNLNFCKIGSIHVFTGRPRSLSTQLEKRIRELAEREQTEVAFTTA